MVKKTDCTKIIEKQTGGTFFDIKQVYKYEVDGKKRKMINNEICLFHVKHQVKSGFKNKDEACLFALENVHKYDKKLHRFL